MLSTEICNALAAAGYKHRYSDRPDAKFPIPPTSDELVASMQERLDKSEATIHYALEILRTEECWYAKAFLNDGIRNHCVRGIADTMLDAVARLYIALSGTKEAQ